MTKTAKERIEEEIKDVNRTLVYSLNKNGRAFNSGKRQGLTIALAHIENAGQSQHYKLSIPKKIAEELEQVAVNNWEVWEFFIYAEEFSTELKNWLNHGKDDNANSKIAIAYLAGKALGVELVGVQG